MDYKDDTKIANAGTFTIHNEDQTLGNLLKIELMSDKANVLFAGYKRPHPLENCVQVKVQTVDEKHPIDVLRGAIGSILNTNSALRKNFEQQMKQIQNN